MCRKHRISHCPGIIETIFLSMCQKTSPFITRQELLQRMVRWRFMAVIRFVWLHPCSIPNLFLRRTARFCGRDLRTLVLSTDNNQDIGVCGSEKVNPVSLLQSTGWRWQGLNFSKDADTKNPLDGAVYGIYTDSKCEHLLMECQLPGRWKAEIVITDNHQTVYVKRN